MSGYDEHVKQVEIGYITEVEIYYPLNLDRLAEYWFMDGETHIIPSGDGILTGNGNVQHFTLDTPVRIGKMSFRGHNTDPIYSHRVDAWIVVEPKTSPAIMGGVNGF